MCCKTPLKTGANRDSVELRLSSAAAAMMGRQRRDQGRLFYEFRLEDRIPENHLLRRMNVFVTMALADLPTRNSNRTTATSAGLRSTPS
jgi:hypothetical protein